MATKKSTASKKKLTPGDTGVDRWTSNGYGIVNGPVSAADKKRIAKLNAELAGGKKKTAPKKGKQ